MTNKDIMNIFEAYSKKVFAENQEKLKENLSKAQNGTLTNVDVAEYAKINGKMSAITELLACIKSEMEG